MVCGVVVKTGISAVSGHFQADNGCDERADEEDAGECDRLVKEDYPDNHCPDGTYARPHRVGRAYGYCLYGLGQQQHTYPAIIRITQFISSLILCFVF